MSSTSLSRSELKFRTWSTHFPSVFTSFCLFLKALRTGSHIVPAYLQLAVLRMTLSFSSSCLHHQSPGIIGVLPGFMHACRTLYPLRLRESLHTTVGSEFCHLHGLMRVLSALRSTGRPASPFLIHSQGLSGLARDLNLCLADVSSQGLAIPPHLISSLKSAWQTLPCATQDTETSAAPFPGERIPSPLERSGVM